MMQQGVTFFYRLFEFFDSEQIAAKDDPAHDLKYNSLQTNPHARGGQFQDSKEQDTEDSGITLFEDFRPNCAVSGAGVICFGDNDGISINLSIQFTYTTMYSVLFQSGWIKFINRDFQVFKFKSHSERIQKLYKTPNSDILIALGKHVDIPNGPVETFMHIWKLLDIDELGNPKKIKSFRLFPESQMEYVQRSQSLTVSIFSFSDFHDFIFLRVLCP